MVDAGNRVSGAEIDGALLIAAAEAAGRSYLEQWVLAAKASANSVATQLAVFGDRLIQSRSAWRKVVSDALAWLPGTTGAEDGVITDASDDKAAWEAASRAIRSEKAGDLDLAELLQGIALRPKEPPSDPDSVCLSTIHASKGLEFDHVWVAGMAEGVLPSWQSLKPEAKPAELEEERRNCFVAITRTRKTVVLTRAASYGGRAKQPSRFLAEMGIPSD